MQTFLSLVFVFLSAGWAAMALWSAQLGLWPVFVIDLAACLSAFTFASIIGGGL